MEIHSRTHSRVARPTRSRRSPGSRALYRSAQLALADGRPDYALSQLDDALAVAQDRRMRAAIQQLRGQIEMWRGDPLRAHELLLTEAEAVRTISPATAASMLADAAFAAASGGELSLALVAARRARTIAARSPAATRAAVDLVVGMWMLLGDEPAGGSRLFWRAFDSIGSRGRGSVNTALRSAGAALYWLEEYGLAAEMLDRLIATARTTGDQLLAGLLDTRAAVDFRLGRWNSAAARSTEALRIARERGQTFQAASCLTTLARIAAARGSEEECRRFAAEALNLAEGNALIFGWAQSAVALLELGLARPDAAITELEKLVASPGSRWTDPAILQGWSDLVEAYVRAGRDAEATRTVAEFEALSFRNRRSWSAAVLSRCRGLLSSSRALDVHFNTALARHREKEVPFERARTELCYGERLRRARRRAAARAQLQSALATFERLGARPWAERARRELQATGRIRSDHPDPLQVLTRHEIEVVSRVRQGSTNREVAEQLFVSERTVEYHLTNIYAKLGVRSRTELAHRLVTSDTEAEGAPTGPTP